MGTVSKDSMPKKYCPLIKTETKEFGAEAKRLLMKCSREVMSGIKRPHMGIRYFINSEVD